MVGTEGGGRPLEMNVGGGGGRRPLNQYLHIYLNEREYKKKAPKRENEMRKARGARKNREEVLKKKTR